MPILHVYVTEGLLNTEQKGRLFEGLTQAVLRGEGAPDNPKTRSVTWVFLHELKKGGGRWAGWFPRRYVFWSKSTAARDVE